MDIKTVKKSGMITPDLLLNVTFDSLEEEKVFGEHAPLTSVIGLKRRGQINLELLGLVDVQKGAENYPKTVQMNLSQLLRAAAYLASSVEDSRGHWPVETGIVRSIGEYYCGLAAANTAPAPEQIATPEQIEKPEAA